MKTAADRNLLKLCLCYDTDTYKPQYHTAFIMEKIIIYVCRVFVLFIRITDTLIVVRGIVTDILVKLLPHIIIYVHWYERYILRFDS